MKQKKSAIKIFFDKFSSKTTEFTGKPYTFIAAVIIVLLWAFTGPLFAFSNTWQLVINTGTTVITFLMVFVIQQSQNKDTIALQLKLNELIASNARASNRLVDIEDLTEDELRTLKKFYIKLADLAKKEQDIFATHSIDEAHGIHIVKKRARRIKPTN